MASTSSSHETSWADQWDPQPHYSSFPSSNSGHSSSSKFSGKTKAAASAGVKKVKAGATAGIQWIKHKYQKTAHKKH